MNSVSHIYIYIFFFYLHSNFTFRIQKKIWDIFASIQEQLTQ